MKDFSLPVLPFCIMTGLFLSACRPTPASPSSMDENPTAASAPDTLHDHLLATGQAFAKATGSLLLGNLTKAMAELGPEGAIAFCNIRAHPLTDSLAQVLHTRIRRVTDKPRNPGNQANPSELDYIQKLKTGLSAGKTPAGAVMEGHKVAYYPIMTNALCLACHGQPGRDIAEATQVKLRALYPEDQATGYSTDEVRGLWVVEFNEPTPKR